jgi:rod shape-determining protein MreC
MLKRPHYMALGVVVFLTIVLLKLPTRAKTNLKLGIRGLFLPPYGATGSVEDSLNRASYAAVPRAELIRQLEALQHERQEARIRQMQADEAVRENARWREQLGVMRQYPWKPRPARVVARDPANWWRTIRIDRGARDGVKTNAPVVTPEGLVGRVSEVGFAQSQVVLVGDPDCRVSVLVGDEKNREQGVITPASSSPDDETLVELSYLSRHSKLVPGQIVVTSGQGGIFPKGLVVGQIAAYRDVGFGLYKEAFVRLAVEMNRLEEVWVLTGDL